MMLDFLHGFLASHPTVSTIVSCIGLLRIFFKPLQLFIKETPFTWDDKALGALEKSKVYPIFRFLLDLGASVKLPKGKSEEEKH
jgi:hypothetical protein